MHILSVTKIYLSCSLLNDWNYFWNKYRNFSIIAICRSQFPLLIFLASPWYQKAKIALRISWRNKKMINYHVKELYKTTCYKIKFNFSQFFSLTATWVVFLFSYQSVCKFWKNDKISSASFACIQKYRKFENNDRNIF